MADEAKNESDKHLPVTSDEDNEFSLWLKGDDSDVSRESDAIDSKWSKYETTRCLDLMKEVRLCLCGLCSIKEIYLVCFT